MSLNVKLLCYSVIQSIQSQQYVQDLGVESALVDLILRCRGLEESAGTEWDERESNEGVNESEVVVCETNHPYQRGRVIKFEPVRFPSKVIAVQLTFDSRCCSDYDNDFMIVSSWYD